MFITIFIVIADWDQIALFVIALLRPSVKKAAFKDKRMLKIVNEKVGMKLSHITVITSGKMYGGMSGLLRKPKMILSSALLKNLNKDELEYVLLHEAAHFKYFHPIIIGLSQIILTVFGLYILQFFSAFSSLVIGVILGLILIQIARITERHAENFAVSHMGDPNAMISAFDKFEETWSKVSFFKLKKFLSWNVSYGEKRRIAKKYIA